MKQASATIFLLLGYLVSGHTQNSLLWKISGNGLETPSYLFGTIHLGDKRFTDLHPEVTLALDATELYAMELMIDSIDMLKLMDRVIMGPEYSIKKLLDEESYKVLDTYFRDNIGIPFSFFDNVYPIFLSYFFIDGTDHGSDSIPILDLYLLEVAREKNKKVRALETAKEQIDAMTSISVKDQVKMLKSEIEDLGETDNSLNDFINLYLEAKIDELMKLSDEYKMPKKLRNSLIKDRNIRMVSRIEKLVSKYSSFVAVGTLHLPGKHGLIKLLRKKGFEVDAAAILN